MKRILRLSPLSATLALGGCNGFSVLNPMGQIGADERWIIIFATVLMLIVVLPVIGMALFFAWRYREGNENATYAPNWSHSGKIEAVVWIIPCLIVGALAVLTWKTSHSLDPYKPIASAEKPIDVDVVSLDWKWLFIYPKLGIASVNQLALPVNVPVKFYLTSNSVMNSFFIPQLGGQIYTMAGMQTQLSLIANHPGSYAGISANYSGSGFSEMDFKALAMSQAQFEAWVKKAKASSRTLDAKSFVTLAKPSQQVPVSYYSSVTPHLFQRIVHKCFIGAGSPCKGTGGNMSAAAAAPITPIKTADLRTNKED